MEDPNWSPQNGRLDTASMLGAPPTVILEPAASPPGGAYAPPPTPGPPPVESRAELRKAKKDIARQLQRSTLRDLSTKALSYGKFWRYAGIGVAIAFVLAFCLPWLVGRMVDAATVAATPATQPATVVRQAGIANPFDGVKLSKQAATFLGAHDSDGDGEVDKLDDTKSALALVAILKGVDLCSWYATVDANFNPVLSHQPVAGYVPFVDCPPPATTTAPPATTTTVPVATTVPAK